MRLQLRAEPARLLDRLLEVLADGVGAEVLYHGPDAQGAEAPAQGHGPVLELGAVDAAVLNQ